MSGQLDWGRITIFWGDGFLLLIFLVILILLPTNAFFDHEKPEVETKKIRIRN